MKRLVLTMLVAVCLVEAGFGCACQVPEIHLPWTPLQYYLQWNGIFLTLSGIAVGAFGIITYVNEKMSES